MQGYCDPPIGIAEWRERRQSWFDAHPADHRACEAALAEVRATLSSESIEHRVRHSCRGLERSD